MRAPLSSNANQWRIFPNGNTVPPQDEQTAIYILEKGLAFRAMHSHGRALNALFARAAADDENSHCFLGCRSGRPQPGNLRRTGGRAAKRSSYRNARSLRCGSSSGRTQRQIHRVGAEHVLGVAVREDRFDTASAGA